MILGDVIRKWRLMKDLDLRTAAKMIGLDSPSTLQRIEQGREPSGATLAIILSWLMEGGEPNGSQKETKKERQAEAGDAEKGDVLG